MKVLKSGKRTVWFNATVVTNNSGKCLPSSLLFELNYYVVPSSLLFQLNYYVVAATYSILVYVRF